MKPTLNTILLIDDDEATNYIHQEVIKHFGGVENIVVRDSGFGALKYLTTLVDGKYPQPDLIFLDVNMPAMDGWEFLDAYGRLEENQMAQTIIVMLSTSLNPDDRDKANNIPLISGFLSKPLSVENLEWMHEKYFRSSNEPIEK